MPAVTTNPSYICARCLPAQRRAPRLLRAAGVHRFVSSSTASQPASPQEDLLDGKTQDDKKKDRNSSNPGLGNSTSKNATAKPHNPPEGSGAMSARLASLAEETLTSGSRTAARDVSLSTSSPGFDEDLKRALEARIANSDFRSENAQAFAVANLPSSAGRGTRDIAGAAPWTGTEALEDVALRMLDDAHKPLRGPSRAGGATVRMPTRVDTGRSAAASASGGRVVGTRLAHARDKAGVYSAIKDSGVSKEEREKLLQEMKDRFQPHARAVPGTIQGLASLANERIEDAIKRGQFKNLPRGQKLERDYTASSPFLDTTEYFMNKIIQKQEIVPPWIEKQQELVSTASKFRSRLRNDWRRHAVRMIASKGGSLEEQIRRAEAYAAAEARENPRSAKKEEKINVVDGQGHLSQITLSGELKVSPSAPASALPDEEITVTETPVETTEPLSQASAQETLPPAEASATLHVKSTPQPSTKEPLPNVSPFRDPAWLQTEHSFLSLSINNLNQLARTYNLQAPRIAQKPYYNLERELNSCYADVAPLLADDIRQRALAPRARVRTYEGSGDAGKKGVLDGLGMGKTSVKVRDEGVERRYGVKEFWRDLWGTGSSSR